VTARSSGKVIPLGVSENLSSGGWFLTSLGRRKNGLSGLGKIVSQFGQSDPPYGLCCLSFHWRITMGLTKGQLEALCRYEETRVDIFAGKALAVMEMSWEPLAAFLEGMEDPPPLPVFSGQGAGSGAL
jgi:hypothetical protein